MKMKILFLGMLMLGCTLTQAQDKRRDGRMSERLKTQKIAFITTNLDLSVEEAEKFWPVYNKYQDMQEELRKESRTALEAARKSDDGITEDEARTLVMNGIEMEQKELDMKKAFIDEVSGVISMKKIAKLRMIEREYKRSMLDKIKKRYRSKDGKSRRP